MDAHDMFVTFPTAFVIMYVFFICSSAWRWFTMSKSELDYWSIGYLFDKSKSIRYKVGMFFIGVSVVLALAALGATVLSHWRR